MAVIQQQQLAAYLTAAANGGDNGWGGACAMRLISTNVNDRRYMWSYYVRTGIDYVGHMRAVKLAFRYTIAVRIPTRCA